MIEDDGGMKLDFQRDFVALWDQLKEDMYLLGTIQVRPTNGLIAIDDWCRLQKLIRKYTDTCLWPSLRTMIYQRRLFLQKQDEIQYRALVKEIVQEEEHVNEEVTMAVLNHFDLTMKQYEDSFQRGHSEINHEEVSNQIVQMRVNLRRREAKSAAADDKTVIRPQNLTRQQTMEIFDFHGDMQLEATNRLQQVDERHLDEEHDVQDALFQDRVFLKFGIEKEDFQLAFEKHDLASDQSVQERHANIADSIPEDLTRRITEGWLSNQQGNEEGEEGTNNNSPLLPNSANLECAVTDF